MLDQTAILIIELGALATAVLAVWILLGKFDKKLNDKIEVIVDKKLDKSEKQLIKIMEEKDVSSNKDVLNELKNIYDKFVEFTTKQDQYNEDDVKRFRVLEQSLVESYKKQIRNIYYSARDDGIIKDSDMAYIQKIYPYYKAMGGNSDIEAKVDELNKVYSEVLQEKFREAREKNNPGEDSSLAERRLKRIKDKEGE